MPELPEVENVRRSLSDALVGRTVESVRVRRRDVVHGSARPPDLLRGCRIRSVRRHGKQLALMGAAAHDRQVDRCVCVHLGMSGSLQAVPAHRRGGGPARPVPHTHVTWTLDDGTQVRFVDPRRFGGIWTFADSNELVQHRWRALGEDALVIRPGSLLQSFQRTQRALKPALLDQNLVAGLGNIYVDELLFNCRLHPLTPCRTLTLNRIQALVRCMRQLLHRATRCGGSTVRDYVDGHGRPGHFQNAHQVYGRAGQSCVRCRKPLRRQIVAGRGTVFCPGCQALGGR
jgi:formamidopyrimidine-DNA glycosylase